MTIKDAYNIVKQLQYRNYLINCLETPDLWAFQFSEELLDQDDFLVGGCFDAVSKKTGELSVIPIPWGLDELEGGNKIDICIFDH